MANTDIDPREFDLIQKQRGQAEFIHSIAQIGEARSAAGPVLPPPPSPAPAPLGVPLWAWGALAVAAVFVATRKRGA